MSTVTIAQHIAIITAILTDDPGLAPAHPLSAFRCLSKMDVANETLRVFSTPNDKVIVHTYDVGGALARVEFLDAADPDRQPIKIVAKNALPSIDSLSATALPFDVIDRDTLRDTIIARAASYLVETGDYESVQDVLNDYAPFDLVTALGAALPLSREVEDDLSTVEFSTENVSVDFSAPGIQGLNTIAGFTFAGAIAGGDWEFPIVFILYRNEGQLRAYIPEAGNLYNHRTMKALGNTPEDEGPGEHKWDAGALRSDIVTRFALA